LRVRVTEKLLDDALAVADAWSSALDLHDLIKEQIRQSSVPDGLVEVVAVGKAAREMASALRRVLGERVQRQLVVVDEGPAFSFDADVEFVIGDHPLPGLGSLMAGERLVEFLEASSGAACTIFLISGGASSLCVLPEPPVGLEDLHQLFAAVLESGADITTLNQLRAASSGIAGGAILRRVRTARSLALIMVDNVISGERWVASGLTFDYPATREDVEGLLGVIGRATGPLADHILSARDQRAAIMSEPVVTSHENRVIAEPSGVLSAVAREASRRGFRVVELGSSLHGDVQDVVDVMDERMTSVSAPRGPFCLVGVGEVTLRVQGSGVGGRCQEFAWRMAEVLEGYERNAVAVGLATDGRDFVKGIAGGWVDNTTLRRARERGVEWGDVVANSDSHRALHELDQLIAGGRSGWNLCDVYLVLVEQ
jgi:glycerate-2-kinase